jgi:phosphate starvation-inducible PhoH-like protein
VSLRKRNRLYAVRILRIQKGTMKRAANKTRREKIQEGTNPLTRKPDRWTESYGFHNFHPTESQKELISKVNNHTLTFVEAPAGTGKSASVLYAFCREYVRDTSKKLIIVRTPVEAGMDKIGALPDDYKSKVAPHFESSKVILEQMLSKGKVESDMDNRIFFKIPNYCLGATFDNSLVMIDECQQLQPMILKLMLERIGLDSRVVVIGDNTQLYADHSNKRNALKDAIPRFFDKDMNSKYDDIAYHSFGVKDVMRSDIVKTVITAYTGLN